MTWDSVLSIVVGAGLAELFRSWVARRMGSREDEPRSLAWSDPADPQMLLGAAERQMLLTRGAEAPCRVTILQSGPNKIRDIKVLRSTLKLGLRDAKELVDNLPQTLREPFPAEQALPLAHELRSSGMAVHLSEVT